MVIERWNFSVCAHMRETRILYRKEQTSKSQNKNRRPIQNQNLHPKIADVRIQIGNVFFVAHGARGVVVRSPIDLKALRRIAMLILCFLRLSKRARTVPAEKTAISSEIFVFFFDLSSSSFS
mmetsp:Transcript_34498/g.52128  ORF Transcript_34498/g.52128 Transcript_34498/m.52128 type:complete len:122 (+) Transcript_34498:2100-2465(+)